MTIEKLLESLANYPDVQDEINSILVVARLSDYKINVRYQEKGSQRVFFCNFKTSNKSIHLDIAFHNDKLTDVCICEGDSQPKCSSKECQQTFCALNVAKQLL